MTTATLTMKPVVLMMESSTIEKIDKMAGNYKRSEFIRWASELVLDKLESTLEGNNG
jgi:hypothetical protein